MAFGNYGWKVNFSNAWDITTGTATDSNALSGVYQPLAVSNHGNNMIYVSNDIFQYVNMPTRWSLVGANQDSSFYGPLNARGVGNSLSGSRRLCLDSDEKFIIYSADYGQSIAGNNSTVFKYSLNTAKNTTFSWPPNIRWSSLKPTMELSHRNYTQFDLILSNQDSNCFCINQRLRNDSDIV